jgi:enamine deaminase RidA (YjgF/YER057c/UK114 family)
MDVERIDVPGLYPKAPYHYATVVGPGDLVFAAGACPLDESGEVVDGPDIPLQMARAVNNLLSALREAGAGPEDVLKTTVYVVATTQDELVRAWSVVEAAFGDARPPSTLLGVSVLGYTGQLVEIEAVAVRRRS